MATLAIRRCKSVYKPENLGDRIRAVQKWMKLSKQKAPGSNGNLRARVTGCENRASKSKRIGSISHTDVIWAATDIKYCFSGLTIPRDV